MSFFYDFAAAFENHYMYQLRRHARELEKEIPEEDWTFSDEDRAALYAWHVGVVQSGELSTDPN